MIRETITFDEVLAFLNEITAVDHAAMQALIAARVPCNDALAEHPTVQVGADSPDGKNPRVGLLGLLNGLLGAYGPEGGSREGWGALAAVYDGDTLVRFERINPNRKEP